MVSGVEHPLFARFFHRVCGRDRGRGERALRRAMLAGISGRVLEVGPGNGINFVHYPSAVTELVAVEPEPYLRAQAAEAAATAPIPVQVIDGVADAIALPSGSFDAVVVSGVLCSVPDQRAALAEFSRLLAPGGELRFYEHVRSRRPAFARWQRRVAPLWSRTMGGCQPDRDTLGAIRAAGFDIERCRSFPFPQHALFYPVKPRILGLARSPAAPAAPAAPAGA